MTSKAFNGFLSLVMFGLLIACIFMIVTVVSLHSDGQMVSNSSRSKNDELKDEEQMTSIENSNFSYISKLCPWESNIRLPTSVIPVHYDLYLHPNLTSGFFSGRVFIHINSLEDRNIFYIHSKKLNISYAEIHRGSSFPPKKESIVHGFDVFESEKNEFLIFKSNHNLSPNNYTLSINFTGSLTNGIVGFYRSLYTNEFGKRVPIVSSKFQPTDARRAFPCFDEPSFKSTFKVTLVKPTKGYIALSNMPVEKEIDNCPHEGLSEVIFQNSVPMVTYLVCFIVCDFEYQEKITNVHQTIFRVYAAPNQRHRLTYALEIGSNITDYFEDYFQTPYPLPKQDMIAIPDFSSGAMEHWGLITYRETNLLFEPSESSAFNQRRVAMVISHELAHQWFGNLVTLSWWDDLWLNEGFASFIEYKGVDNYHKDWEIQSQFLFDDLHSVLSLDATINSHPIIQTVHHPNQITEIFDKISYSKGASILRMLENFMGNEEFRIGISRFLQRYKYGNAQTSDLWKELEKVSSQNHNISRIMDTWTRQMGFPLVTVESLKDNKIRIRQSRYLRDPETSFNVSESPFGYKWEIPLTWKHLREGDNEKEEEENEKEIQRNWLGLTDDYIEIKTLAKTWIKLNVNQFGFYRVNYPKDHWLTFISILQKNPRIFSLEDRASLLNDAFSLAESRHIDYSIPLSLIQYLRKENHLVPWRTAVISLNALSSLLYDTSAYQLYRKYLLTLVQDPIRDLSWEDSGSMSVKLLRTTLLAFACKHGHKGCLDESAQLFSRWILEKGIFISPNMRKLVYRYGMEMIGNYESWSIMLERYRTESNAQEKDILLNGLAWSREPWILSQLIDYAQNESIIRRQDFFIALRYISYNPIGTPLVWDYIRENWNTLIERFGSQNYYLGRIPMIISQNFKTNLKLKELLSFFDSYPEGGAGERSRKQAVENIQNNIKWIKSHVNSIKSWLISNV